VAAELESECARRGIPDSGRLRRDGQQVAVRAEGEIGAFLAEERGVALLAFLQTIIDM
jgi:hypothetical protein